MLLRLALLLALMASSTVLSDIPARAQEVGISRSDVFIIASTLTDPSGGVAGGPSPNQVVSPLFDPLVMKSRYTGQDHEILLDVPDMDPTSSGPRSGIQEGIAAGASVTVTFTQRASIRNPTEGGAISIDVITSPGGAAAGVDLKTGPNTPGAAAEYRITFVAPADLPANSGSITIVLDEDVQLPGTPSTPDEEGMAAELSVARSALPESALAGDTLSYELTIANQGPGEATMVTLTESLPSGTTLVSITPSQGACVETGRGFTCDIAALPSQSTATVFVELALESSLSGELALTASVAGGEADPDRENNEVAGNIRVIMQPTPTVPPTVVPTATSTPVPTATSEPTPTPVPAATPTPPATPTPTMEATPTAAPTPTSTLSATPTPTSTPPPTGGLGGSCLATFGRVPATVGMVNLLLLLAPLAGIVAYRRRWWASGAFTRRRRRTRKF